MASTTPKETRPEVIDFFEPFLPPALILLGLFAAAGMVRHLGIAALTMTHSGEAIGILLLVIVVGRFLLQPFMHRIAHARSPEVFTALTVLLVLGSALITEHLGLSMAMGAFIAGLMIADSPFRHEIIAQIEE